MKVIHKNLRTGELKVQVSCLDDLWYLSHVIDPGDLVSGKTFRKMKVGSADKSVKKPVFVKIEVERVEFHKYSNTLRVMGVVREGSEEVPHGSHHTLDVDEDTKITIQKKKWLKFQLDRVEEACKSEVSDVLVCIFDREEVSFALLKKYGFDMLSEFKGDVAKKDAPEKIKGDFYMEISKQLKDYVDRLKISKVIVASPAFWKEDFMKVLKKAFPDVASKVTLATCSNTGSNGIEEVLIEFDDEDENEGEVLIEVPVAPDIGIEEFGPDFRVEPLAEELPRLYEEDKRIQAPNYEQVSDFQTLQDQYDAFVIKIHGKLLPK